MLSDLQKSIVAIVETRPGTGPGPVADMIGRDKSQTRRAMRDLAQRGHLIEQGNGNGYAYFPAGGAASIQENAGDHHRLERRQPEPPVIDADYREVSTPPSQSRAVALVPKGSEQPFDSRTQAALAQHAHARRSPQRHNGTPLASPFAASLNSFFASDPNGDEALANLAQAMNNHASAIQSAQDRAELNHAADIAQRREEAAKREATEREEQKKEEIHQAMMAMLGWGSLRSRAEPEETRIPERQSEDTIREHIHFVEEEPEDYDGEPEPFDDEPLPPIDIETYRDAKTEQRRQAAHPDYGDNHFVQVAGASGRTLIKPTISRTSLGDLVEYQKLRRRGEEAARRRSGTDHAPGRRSGAVQALFAKAKTSTMTDDSGQSSAPRSCWDWLKRHLSTPKKPQWR